MRLASLFGLYTEVFRPPDVGRGIGSGLWTDLNINKNGNPAERLRCSIVRDVFSRLPKFVDSVAARVWLIVAARRSPWVQRLGYGLMLLLFCAGVIWSVTAAPGPFGRLEFRWVLLILFVGVPLTVVLNIVRYYLVGRMLGQRLTLRTATLVVLVGRAASLLPIPGGLIVRAAGLSENGERYSAALMANLASSVLWFGLAGLYSGVSAFALGRGLLGGVLVAARRGILHGGCSVHDSLLAASRLYRYISNCRESATAGSRDRPVLDVSRSIRTALRTRACRRAQPQWPGRRHCGSFTWGLGVTEGTAALLAQAVGLAAGEGFMLAALNRVVADAAMLPLILGLYVRRGSLQIRARESGE